MWLILALLTGLLLLFLSLMLTVYALFVIAAVAADEWQPPSPLDVMSEGGLLLKQIALMVVLFVGPVLLMPSSMVLGMGLLALAALVLPAALMILAVSHSLGAALNPLRWLQLIVTVGVSYLLLWLYWKLAVPLSCSCFWAPVFLCTPLLWRRP